LPPNRLHALLEFRGEKQGGGLGIVYEMPQFLGLQAGAEMGKDKSSLHGRTEDLRIFDPVP